MSDVGDADADADVIISLTQPMRIRDGVQVRTTARD